MPEHPLHQLTTAELAAYRRDLERALQPGRQGLPPGAPARADIAAALERVAREEESRASIARANGAP